MYYAIKTVNRYLATAYNATSSFEVREQIFQMLSKDVEHSELLHMSTWPLEEILATRGLTLERRDKPFPTIVFRVVAAVTTYAYLDVRADSVEEAREMAGETDGGEYYTMDTDERPGSFNIIEVNIIP